MKTNILIRIVLYSLVIVLLLGILMAGIGWNLFSFRRNSVRTESLSTEVSQPDSTAPQAVSLSTEGLRSIRIDWAAGSIVVEPTDGTEIQLYESAPQGSEPMVVKQSGSELKIAFCENNSLVNLGKNLKKDLHVALPRDWECSKLEVDAASATVFLRELTCGQVDIHTASGSCDMTDCKIGSIDMESASGDLRFSGTLEELDFEGVSARADVSVFNVPSRIEMESVSGDMTLTLPRDCGFRVKRDSISGGFQCDFETTREDGCHVYGDGSCRIDVSGVSARLTIHSHGEDAAHHKDSTEPASHHPEEHS